MQSEKRVEGKHNLLLQLLQRSASEQQKDQLSTQSEGFFYKKYLRDEK
jgi:hypothetical protein